MIHAQQGTLLQAAPASVIRSTPAGAFSDKFFYFLRLEMDKKHSLAGSHSTFEACGMVLSGKILRNWYKSQYQRWMVSRLRAHGGP